MTNSENPEQPTARQELEQAIVRKLREGERVVWQGAKLARFEPRGCFVYVIAIPWIGFAAMWINLALMGAFEEGVWVFGLLTALLGVPFLLAGLATLATPFLSFFQRGRVLFAITNTRVLKASLGREMKVISIPSSRIKSANFRESADGTGTIDLKLTHRVASFGGRQSYKMALGRIEGIKSACEAITSLTD